jgi:hypothetical protein
VGTSAPNESWLVTDKSWLGTDESWLGTDKNDYKLGFQFAEMSKDFGKMFSVNG